MVVGRWREQQILTNMLRSHRSELVAIYGRRRIGKTFLIREHYANRINFSMVGLQNGNLNEQLNVFASQLTLYSKSPIPMARPEDWLTAFYDLREYLETIKSKKKRVIFFDEFPWIATPKSNFVETFAHFWNSWAENANLVIVIAGSSASWMVKNVINARGGLHNRLTKLIRLAPFTLAETETFLKHKKVNLNQYQIVQLYMAMGGVPHYLKEIKPGLSAAQNIDAICFSNTGILKNEYKNLYAALFSKPEKHLQIIELLSKKWKGYTRSEIIKQSKFTNGGALTKILTELEECSFISSYSPFGKMKRETLYRLTDEYSMFYLKFIKPNSFAKKGLWMQLSQKQTWKSWSGFAFESLCLKHLEKIKNKLGISGVYTRAGSFVYKGENEKEGFQIDLLIDREDRCINLCEMKFYDSKFIVTKKYADELRKKNRLFQESSKTKKHLFVTLVTTFGLDYNEDSLGLIDNVVEMGDLFK